MADQAYLSLVHFLNHGFIICLCNIWYHGKCISVVEASKGTMDLSECILDAELIGITIGT